MIKLNRGQLFGLDLDRHIALDAGAGTGKTLVMAKRYVQHLLTRDQRSTRLLSPDQEKISSAKAYLPIRKRTGLQFTNGAGYYQRKRLLSHLHEKPQQN